MSNTITFERWPRTWPSSWSCRKFNEKFLVVWDANIPILTMPEIGGAMKVINPRGEAYGYRGAYIPRPRYVPSVEEGINEYYSG